jgi:hypothetical protein
MQLLSSGYKGLELLVELNVDRVIWILALGGALFLAAYIGAPH